MKLKEMSKSELELLSYPDLTYIILKENGKPMNTPSIFKEICGLFEYGEDIYSEKVGDFYTSLTTDKRFLLLDSAEWDLRENHVIKMEVEEDDEETDEEEIDEEIEEEMDEEDIDSEMIDDDIDDDDLSIVSEEELEED